MDNKKRTVRKRPIKIEIESDFKRSNDLSSDDVESKKSTLIESKSDEEIETSRACASKYFKNDDLKYSFDTFEINVEKEEFKSEKEQIEDKLEHFAKKQKWEPNNWRELFELIRQMRGEQAAPVDTMGCDAIASIDPNLSPENKRFHVLVSLMLSSQTKDEVTSQAMNRLQKLPLNIENILTTPDEHLEKLIYPVSFYKRKVIYIKKTALILKEKYNSDIPQTVNELQKLPGVGPKMAYLTMTCAWKEIVGIGVDTHVHRISNRLGWTRSQTKTPEQTRKELEDWLPQSHWEEVNHLLVGFGQTTCRPVGPHCVECLCQKICPHGKKTLSSSASKKNKSKKSI